MQCPMSPFFFCTEIKFVWEKKSGKIQVMKLQQEIQFMFFSKGQTLRERGEKEIL